MAAFGRVHPARMTAARHQFVVAAIFEKRLLVGHSLTVGGRSAAVKM
jgi:hypothetical protein